MAITATITIEFEKVKFKPYSHNDGRCLKCGANQICGPKFKCPCNMDEQLVQIKTTVHET